MPIILFGQIWLILSVSYSVSIPLSSLLKRSQLCWQYAQPETKMANGCTMSNRLVSCGKSKENKQTKIIGMWSHGPEISNL